MFDARVRRGLRRAVLLHPRRRVGTSRRSGPKEATRVVAQPESASPTSSPSRASSATATTCPASGSTRRFDRRRRHGALHRRTCRPWTEMRPDRRRGRRSTRSTTSRRAGSRRSPSGSPRRTLDRYFCAPTRTTSARGCSRSCSRIARAGCDDVPPPARTARFPQMLLLSEWEARRRADKIYGAIVASHRRRRQRLLPILRPYDHRRLHPVRRLRHDQARLATAPSKCHLNHVVMRHRLGSEGRPDARRDARGAGAT